MSADPGREKVRWGVLGTAKIAVGKVIPAMQIGEWSEIAAIASRDPERARSVAGALGIPKAYGSYEQLLDDRDVDAVYIPLPNHLHVPWTIKSARAGKHVLCEKPIALSAAEAERLLAVRDETGVKIQEAFMIRAHPQWHTAVDLVRRGELGDIRSIVGYFSYDNPDPSNIRNVAEFGGGGLADIGCYLVHAARWVLGREPARVIALVDRDPVLTIDRLASLMLDFGDAQVLGMCATQLVPSQRMHVFGTKARLEMEIPFNAPRDTPCRLFVNERTIEIPVCDQYTLQGDAFSRAIREGTDQALSLESSIGNMRVLDAINRSAASGAWE